ncbi:MAG: hypothetical protein WCA78_06335 [Rhizomicrobium sp.]
MTSKVEQLFLELCLLRLRYSQTELQQVANMREVMDDPDLRTIVAALRYLQMGEAASKRTSVASKKYGRTSRASLADVRRAIVFFIDRITDKRILRTKDQIDNFARSLGLVEMPLDRQELISAIKKRLEIMPAEQAMLRMRSADSQFKSDSDPYVDLAKTLMGR